MSILVLMAIAMFFIPDSPVHLIHKGKEDDARKSLKWLRGSEYSGIEKEIAAIKVTEAERNQPDSRVPLMQIFSKAVYLKPFGICLGIMFLQQFSGMGEILFYLQDIFKEAGSDIDPGLSGAIVTFVQVKP